MKLAGSNDCTDEPGVTGKDDHSGFSDEEGFRLLEMSVWELSEFGSSIVA